jgi:hypothetical protein
MNEEPTNRMIPISESEKAWLKQIFIAMTSQTMTDDTIQLAMELAFKKGYEAGNRGK